MIMKTLKRAATLLPSLSTIYPIKKHPNISPTPNNTIASSAFLYLSLRYSSVSPGSAVTAISANDPEKYAILIPVQNN
jgi:hypothetical protein